MTNPLHARLSKEAKRDYKKDRSKNQTGKNANMGRKKSRVETKGE
jgi:hypothetical protein